MSEPNRPLGSPWLRCWHVVQAAAFLGLIVSGAAMHWASEPWSPLSFSRAVTVHNVSGFVSLLSLIVFLIGSFRRGNLRHYHLRGAQLSTRLWPQLRYYAWGIFRHEPEPFPPRDQTKFNPAQRLAYSIVMYVLMPIAALSGALLFFPFLAPEHALGQPGLLPMAIIHLSAGYLLTAFLVLHVYLTLFLHSHD